VGLAPTGKAPPYHGAHPKADDAASEDIHDQHHPMAWVKRLWQARAKRLSLSIHRAKSNTLISRSERFAMQSYHLMQRGPAFADDTEISLQRGNTMSKASPTNGQEAAIDGTLELLPDVSLGSEQRLTARSRGVHGV
jgi:hypothetical protein